MVQINDDNYEDLTFESTTAVLEALARGETPKPGPQRQPPDQRSGRRPDQPAGDGRREPRLPGAVVLMEQLLPSALIIVGVIALIVALKVLKGIVKIGRACVVIIALFVARRLISEWVR
jgi:hypothetical protein